MKQKYWKRDLYEKLLKNQKQKQRSENSVHLTLSMDWSSIFEDIFCRHKQIKQHIKFITSFRSYWIMDFGNAQAFEI